MIASTVLALAAEAFFTVLFEATANQIFSTLNQKLKGDPAVNAFKFALGIAIRRYASDARGSRLLLAEALKNGLLAKPVVANELARIVRFASEPDYVLIGNQWKDMLVEPPAWVNFSKESEFLVELLTNALQETDVFRPVFVSKSLKAIELEASVSAESLTKIENHLNNLIQLMESLYANTLASFALSSRSLYSQIRDFTFYIDEKTRDFVGRQFLFDALDEFLSSNSRGYFFVRGDPGIGKTAFAAQLVKNGGHIHHFNIRAEGVNNADDFLRSVCAQLIAVYDLKRSEVPPDATEDSGFLRSLLVEVSDKMVDSKCLIIIDALDEVDASKVPKGVNLLLLPTTLPSGIYIVVTSRREHINLRIECEQSTIYIEQNDKGNIADIQEYIALHMSKPGIQSYIVSQGIDERQFKKHLVDRSQGNFMYLQYILPEIEQGRYSDFGLESLPSGLQNYYEQHWQHLKGQDEDAWFDFKLRVLVALTAVRQPVSIDLIKRFSRVKQTARVASVLEDWSQFLFEEEFEYSESPTGRQTRYRLYHASFFDFVVSKQEVEGERVDLQAMHSLIADELSRVFD